MKWKALNIKKTERVLLSKLQEKRNIKFALAYFNSAAQTVINLEYDIDKSFKKFCTELIIRLMKNLVG